MKVTEPEQAQRFAVLYKATIDHAVKGAPDLMALAADPASPLQVAQRSSTRGQSQTPALPQQP